MSLTPKLAHDVSVEFMKKFRIFFCGTMRREEVAVSVTEKYLRVRCKTCMNDIFGCFVSSTFIFIFCLFLVAMWPLRDLSKTSEMGNICF